jgi:sodium-dependent phosphate transporter
MSFLSSLFTIVTSHPVGRLLVDQIGDGVCSSGVFSCQYVTEYQSDFDNKFPKGYTEGTCANYNEAYIDPSSNYVLLIFTALVACSMAFAIGANDGANAWGTTIHSFAIGLKKACLLGGIFEILGASTLGYGVSTSIQKGISNLSSPDCFACGYCNSSMTLYYVGMMAALISGSIFALVATWFKIPVSTTHTMVSSVLGMTAVYQGFGCIEFGWKNLGGILASWVISPIAAGISSILLYHLTNFLIFKAKNPRQRAYIFLPVLYFSVVFVVCFLSFIKAPALKGQPRWIGVAIGAVLGVVAAGSIVVFLFPYLKKNLPSINETNRIGMHLLMTGQKADRESLMEPYTDDLHTPSKDEKATKQQLTQEAASTTVADQATLQLLDEYNALTMEQQDAMYMFKHLLILVACLQSFSHGANETSNATAALTAVITGFSNGINQCIPAESTWWVNSVGGFFLAAGIWFMGYKVMETIGKDICIVNFQRAFCTEFSTSAVVVTCSLLNIPISTTHCQVGGVLFISMVSKDLKEIDWNIVLKIVFSWMLTFPIAACLAAFVSYLLKFAVVA